MTAPLNRHEVINHRQVVVGDRRLLRLAAAGVPEVEGLFTVPSNIGLDGFIAARCAVRPKPEEFVDESGLRILELLEGLPNVVKRWRWLDRERIRIGAGALSQLFHELQLFTPLGDILTRGINDQASNPKSVVSI